MAIKDSVLNVVIKAKDLTKGALDKFKKGIKQTGDESEKTESKLSRLAKSFGAVVVAAVGFTTVKNAFVSVLSTGDKFEKLSVQLTSVMGSIEGGKQATEWIKDFTKNTPLQLEGVTEAFTKLKSFGLDPMDGTMQAIVDQSEKLGGGQEKLAGISTALGKAWAKQKLQGEEIMQLVERGVPIYELLAEVTGKNGAELQKMQEKGELTRDVIKQVIDAMGQAATGSAAANMTLLSGYVSNLKDAWQEFQNEIANAGLLDYAKDQIKQLSETIKRMNEDGSLKEFAQKISGAMIQVGQAIKSLIVGIYESRKAIEIFAKALVAVKLASFVRGIGAAAAAMGTTLVGGAVAATAATKALLITMRAVPYLALAEAIIHTGKAFFELSDANEAARKSMAESVSVTDQAAKAIAEFNEQTGLSVTSLDAMISAQESGLVVLDQTTKKWMTSAQAAKQQAEALKNNKTIAEQLAQYIGTQLSAAQLDMIENFKAATAEAQSASEAIASMTDGYEFGSIEGLQNMAVALTEIQKAGIATREEIVEGLGASLAKLTDEEIAAFEVAIKAAFDTGQTEVLELLDLLSDGKLSGAIQKLGIDMGIVENGISTIGQTSINAFNTIIESQERTSDKSGQTARLIEQAYLNSFKKIQTEAGKKDLLAGLNKALKKGLITTAQYNQIIKKTGQDTKNAGEDAKAAADKFKKLRLELERIGGAGLDMGDEVDEGAGKAGGGGGASLMDGAIKGWINGMKELSESSEAAFKELAFGAKAAADGGEIGALKSRIDELNDSINETRIRSLSLQDQSGLQGFFANLRMSAEKTEVAYSQQKIEFIELMDAYKSGEISMESFIKKAERANRSLNLLNKADLKTLDSAIGQANSKMESLRSSTRGTLEGLQSELDRLQGNTEAAELRKLASRERTLADALKKAQESGDSKATANAREALNVARQITAERKKQLADERQAKALDESRAKAEKVEKTRQDTPASQAQTTPQTTIKLVAGNRTVNVATNDQAGLLEVLQSAGLRSS